MIRSCLLLLTFACFISGGLAGDLRFPQFVQGGTESGYYVTEIVFFNTATTTSSGFIYFRDDNGEPLPVELDNGSSGSTFPFNLGPGSSKVIRSTGTGPLKVGWVDVDEVSGSGLGGVLTFALYEASGRPQTEVTVQPSTADVSFSFPVEFSDVSNTGIALANLAPLGTEVPIVLLLLDSNGVIAEIAKVAQFGGQNHLARFIDQWFPTIQGPFSGTLWVAASAAEPAVGIAVTGLKLREGVFSSIPATSGFFLRHAYPILAETSNNNSIADAQAVASTPFTLGGAIEAPGDRDFYQLTLDQDELLIGLIEAYLSQGEVQVHNAGGELMATYRTKLNGTQAIIFRAPSSGAYRLSVGDVNDDWGAEYATYLLTVMRVK